MKKLISIALGVVVLTFPTHAQDFKINCEFPLQLKDLKKKRSIDSDCTVAGSGSAASKAQNTMKNNFCGTGVTNPVVVTIPDLRNLHRKTAIALRAKQIPFGSPTAIPEFEAN